MQKRRHFDIFQCPRRNTHFLLEGLPKRGCGHPMLRRQHD